MTAPSPRSLSIRNISRNPTFPTGFLMRLGSSRSEAGREKITPEKRSKAREPEETITTELFVMGPRSAFRSWNTSLPQWDRDIEGADDLPSIEQVAAPSVQDKIKGRLPKAGEVVFEVVLHSDAGTQKESVVSLFREYLKTLGLGQPLARRFSAGGLSFVELDAPVDQIDRITTFTPVRALRQMPTLRMLRPTFRSSRVPMDDIGLPSAGPVDPNIKVAIFDGAYLRDTHSRNGPRRSSRLASAKNHRVFSKARCRCHICVLVRAYRPRQAAAAALCRRRSLTACSMLRRDKIPTNFTKSWGGSTRS